MFLFGHNRGDKGVDDKMFLDEEKALGRLTILTLCAPWQGCGHEGAALCLCLRPYLAPQILEPGGRAQLPSAPCRGIQTSKRRGKGNKTVRPWSTRDREDIVNHMLLGRMEAYRQPGRNSSLYID